MLPLNILKGLLRPASRARNDSMTNIILPELGEGISKATVACWHFKVGQQVKAGDEILEVVEAT